MNAMKPSFELFIQKINTPIKYGFFLATQLPAAFFVGLKLKHIDPQSCSIGIRHSWFNKNPFKSMYFAAQAMAAEMSTGLLAFGHLYQIQPSVSMLVVRMEVNYTKKGTGKLLFTCKDGNLIKEGIDKAIQTGEAQQIQCTCIGNNEQGEVVSTFTFTWSFKSK
jgi:acyl-coenzyme A thioesterase PaaI-like protein